MMHEEICTYEVCKLVKEKGFNEKCYHYYQNGALESDGCFNRYNKGVDSVCSAPTQSLLQRWLRKEKGVHICIDNDLDFDDEKFIFEWQIAYKENFDNGEFIIRRYSDQEFYSTYEEALEEAIKYALENLV